MDNLTKISIEIKTILINGGSQNVSLEGINWSLFNGIEVKLQNNYKTIDSSNKLPVFYMIIFK